VVIPDLLAESLSVPLKLETSKFVEKNSIEFCEEENQKEVQCTMSRS